MFVSEINFIDVQPSFLVAWLVSPHLALPPVLAPGSGHLAAKRCPPEIQSPTAAQWFEVTASTSARAGLGSRCSYIVLDMILDGNPLQYSCLENPRDRGAWWAAVYGVAQSRTRLKRLSSSSSSIANAESSLSLVAELVSSNSLLLILLNNTLLVYRKCKDKL